ncbi:hypothetical protein [Bartonella tamiae]|nr:hypothetical protein [Bartonella tamiae]
MIFFSVNSFAQNDETHSKKEEFYLAPIHNPAMIANYPLNEAFLTKMEIVQREMTNQSVYLTVQETGNDVSINGLISAIEKNEKISTILKNNGLSPNDYIVGYMALQAALAAASSAEDKDAIFDETTTVSPQNLEFGKKNTDRIRQLLENIS